MSDYWDIDGSTGEIDEYGNEYRNESFRTNEDGEIEELTEDGWEYSAHNVGSFDLNFGDDDSESQGFDFSEVSINF